MTNIVIVWSITVLLVSAWCFRHFIAEPVMLSLPQSRPLCFTARVHRYSILATQPLMATVQAQERNEHSNPH